MFARMVAWDDEHRFVLVSPMPVGSCMDMVALRDAVQRALALRGTVMLSVRDDGDRWCAVCAAVDGSFELRVAEPPRGWRRWRAPAGDQWLRDHDFVHVLDAWSAPAPARATPRWCAEALAAALNHSQGVARDAAMVQVLEYPGTLGDAEPPPPEAPHSEHVRHVLRSLATHRRGKVSFEGGRPASTWAWAFVVGDGLVLSPEPEDASTQGEPEWTVPLRDEQVIEAADRLTTLMHHDHGRKPTDPLFISMIGT